MYEESRVNCNGPEDSIAPVSVLVLMAETLKLWIIAVMLNFQLPESCEILPGGVKRNVSPFKVAKAGND